MQRLKVFALPALVFVLFSFVLSSCGPVTDGSSAPATGSSAGATNNVSVSIAAPGAEGTTVALSTLNFTLSGTTACLLGSDPVTNVFVRVNNQTNTAVGTSNWSIALNLSNLYTNQVTVFVWAKSVSGLVSSEKYLTVTIPYTSVAFEQFFDNSKIHSVTIDMTASEWSNFNNDFDGNPNNSIKRQANFTYRQSGTTSDVFYDNVGIRVTGNTSRVKPSAGRFHFMIDFNDTFDEDEGIYGSTDLAPISNNLGRRFCSTLKTVKFKEDKSDLNMMLETFSYNLFNLVGLAAPRTGYAKVTIRVISGAVTNSIVYGIYKTLEHVDESFLNRNFGKKATTPSHGDMYKCLYTGNGPADLKNAPYKIGYSISDPIASNADFPYDCKVSEEVGSSNFTAMKSFLNNLNNLSGAAFQTWIEANFEVTNFLKFLALTTLVGMSDDYWCNANNYYLYHDIVTGKWNLIPYDYDNTFGSLNLGAGGHTSNRNILAFGDTANRPLISKIFAIPSYLTMYKTFITNFCDTVFTAQAASNFMNPMLPLFAADRSSWQKATGGWWGQTPPYSTASDVDFTYIPGDYIRDRVNSARLQAFSTIGVTISSPLNNTTALAGGSITVSGTATATAGVMGVYLATNTGSFSAVSGTTSWTTNLTLPVGSYSVKVYTIDGIGNSSTTQSITVQVVTPRFVTGTLSGNFSNVGVIAYDYVHYLIYPAVISNTSNFTIDVTSIPVSPGFEVYLYSYTNTNLANTVTGYYYRGFIGNLTNSTNIGNLDFSTNKVSITVDDSANANSQIFMYGTISSTNRGGYATDFSGDVVNRPYLMTSLGNNLWSVDMLLFTGSRYIFKFNNSTNTSTWLGSVDIWNTNSDPVNLTYTNPSAHLSKDVTVMFSVCMSNTNGLSALSIRGNSYPLNWQTSPFSILNDSGTNGDTTAGDQVWTGSVTFTNGSSSYFEYKFLSGTSYWEESIANRKFIINSSLATNYVPMAYFDNNR